MDLFLIAGAVIGGIMIGAGAMFVIIGAAWRNAWK